MREDDGMGSFAVFHWIILFLIVGVPLFFVLRLMRRSSKPDDPPTPPPEDDGQGPW
ncbi:MAG: hypothetical protein P8Q36_16405 [Alphaproteobacteria bacterium]|jgi:hypothetical protein|nr:hypothetical protein [Rhodospirillaceae bacterium]MBT6509285.1 hypothetical protein [Rhodospirillaceae bacterium]MBT7613651.1 hypothetical protein [Rhodospirillaceae bacterium]MBT7647885.1 hypothetical protein [Rhodospirillaceae bacterium]MDG2482429.1 hypothetical protein [Alphaproteobacteria bacterium]